MKRTVCFLRDCSDRFDPAPTRTACSGGEQSLWVPVAVGRGGPWWASERRRDAGRCLRTQGWTLRGFPVYRCTELRDSWFSILITKKIPKKLVTLPSLPHFPTFLARSLLSFLWSVGPEPSVLCIHVWQPLSSCFSLNPDSPVSKEATSLNPRARVWWGVSESQGVEGLLRSFSPLSVLNTWFHLMPTWSLPHFA